MYRSLNAEKIADTVGNLKSRIQERFPGSGLSRVAKELEDVAHESVSRSKWVAKPIMPLRLGVGLLVTVMLAVLVAAFLQLNLKATVNEVGSLLQMLQAGIDDIVFMGIGIYFLVTLEARIKRKVVLRAMHELRSLAHIVDTHQLTKDPEVLLRPGSSTPSSPVRTMTAFELSRYLDYCSEMLSLLGKIAALYVQEFDDPTVLDAVDDMEDLTIGLARKIWQKIALLNRFRS